VLLEVNISGDQAKHGFDPTAMDSLLPELSQMNGLRVLGLMAMAGREGGVDRARREFSALRVLRDQLQVNCPESIQLDTLSMGMSGDFEAAIEEGATMVRVGSALYTGLDQ